MILTNEQIDILNELDPMPTSEVKAAQDALTYLILAAQHKYAEVKATGKKIDINKALEGQATLDILRCFLNTLGKQNEIKSDG